jgi:SAM-dependent methyltransferase
MNLALPTNGRPGARSWLLRLRDGLRAPCRACGRRDVALLRLGTVAPTHHAKLRRRRYRLVHCDGCDVVYLDPLPPAADLRALYEEHDQFTDATYTEPARVEAMLDYYGQCLDRLKLLPEPGAAMLEVGAGLAWVSRAAKLRRAEVRTVAQDVTAECAARCAWVDSYVVDSVARLPPEPQYQLISLTHVIEHVTDPGATIGMLAQRLVDGGALFLTAPYRPAQWTRADGIGAWQAYEYLHVPAHISYLSEAWFRHVATVHGLTLVHWNAEQDGSRAFEAVLRQPPRPVVVPAHLRLFARLRDTSLRLPAPLRGAVRALWHLLPRRHRVSTTAAYDAAQRSACEATALAAAGANATPLGDTEAAAREPSEPPSAPREQPETAVAGTSTPRAPAAAEPDHAARAAGK